MTKAMGGKPLRFELAHVAHAELFTPESLHGLPPPRLDHDNLIASDVTTHKALFEQSLGFGTHERPCGQRERRNRDRGVDERQHPRP